MTPALATLLLAVVALKPTLDWRPTVDEAFAEAKRDGKVVFLAINMDGERANDWMVDSHYRDPTIRRLAEHTVNLFASRFDHRSGDRPCPRVGGGPPCSAHLAIDKRVRRDFVTREPDGSVIAPQHLFLDGEGTVLLSVQYQLTVGELEWCFVTAIRRLDPAFAWTFSRAAKAPKRLVADGVAPPEDEPKPDPPPSKEEIKEILERSKKAGRATRPDLGRLIRSEDKRAVEFVRTQANSKWAGKEGHPLGNLLHDIGASSPESWWTFVAPYLEDNRPVVRRQAAVALEELAVEKSLSKLFARWKKEEDPAVRGDVLRALTGVGPANKKVISLVRAQAAKARNVTVRAAAVTASASLDDRIAVLDLCRPALAAEEPRVRGAAAYVVAVRREADLRPFLEERALLETSAVAKQAFEVALQVLDGGSARLLRPVLRELFDGEIMRDRR